jgi:phosphoenolpyruvate carboxylase
MQELFEKTSRFKSEEFTQDNEMNTDYIEMIPLIESAESQQTADKLLGKYVVLHQKHHGKKPEYLRPFLACSDSSLSAGYLAGLIGNKVGLARLYEFSDKMGVSVFPIAGSGSLHFRGGLSPDKIDRFVQEFPGIRTVSVQSAFRYDNPLKDVKTAVKKLGKMLPAAKPLAISQPDQETLTAIGRKSATHYKQTLNGIIPDMEHFFEAVPKRRDRRQHIGLLAYSRSTGDVTLPRAITFTAAFYSIGIPPELIGLGRTLKELDSKQLATLKEYYPNLIKDTKDWGQYFNEDNLAKLVAKNKAWKMVEEDVQGVKDVLGVALGPDTENTNHHSHYSSHMLLTQDPEELSDLIYQSGILRRSLG